MTVTMTSSYTFEQIESIRRGMQVRFDLLLAPAAFERKWRERDEARIQRVDPTKPLRAGNGAMDQDDVIAVLDCASVRPISTARLMELRPMLAADFAEIDKLVQRLPR